MKKETPVNTNIDDKKIMSYLEAMNVASTLSEAEKRQFIEICHAFGLNPFKREIYASKFGSTFSIIVGYETYIKRAERSGRIAGWNVTTSGKIDDGTLKAIITIHRKDWEHPFIHEVYYAEYVGKTKDGYITKFWKDKPYTMLKKVAISQGFRLCFSDELGGMPYTSEEMGSEEHFTSYIPVEPKEIEAPKPQPLPDFEEPKRGRPKKQVGTFEQIRGTLWNELMVRIELADSVDELKAIYSEYKTYHEDGEFMAKMSKRRKEIESGITVQKAEIIDVIEEIPKDLFDGKE